MRSLHGIPPHFLIDGFFNLDSMLTAQSWARIYGIIIKIYLDTYITKASLYIYIYIYMLSLVLVGPMGHGKSSTGNTLLRRNCFTLGDDSKRITRKIQIEEDNNNNYLIIDCPGFGDIGDKNIFHNEFIKNQNRITTLLCDSPIKAFIFVIKFNLNKSDAFLEAAEEFFKLFGSLGIRSVILLCIQVNEKRISSKTEFEDILINSDGYKFFSNKINKDIPWCLWDNEKNRYPNQKNEFRQCLDMCTPYDNSSLNMSFDLINIDMENLRNNNINNAPKESKQSWDFLTILSLGFLFGMIFNMILAKLTYVP